MTMGENGVAAFFDLDHTVLAINTMSDFHWYHARHRRCRSSGWAGSVIEKACHRALAQVRFVRLLLAALADASRVTVNRQYYAGLRGIDAEEYDALARRWFAELNARSPFNAEVVNRLRAHQTRRHVVVLVSGSHDVLVRHVGREMGIEHVIATDVEVTRGRFSGRMLSGRPLVSEGKAEAIRAFAQAHGIDLARSHAYSDHASDLPMLETVGHPCAVVGDKRLLVTARSRNWAVIET